jgi:hypothetical protein
MNKLSYIFIAGMSLLATACTIEEDDLFEESAAQRMNNAVLSNTELLESSENGWVFNYFVGHDDDSQGGLVHTIRFKDGKSYFRSEAAVDPYAEYASLYQVKGEQECLLTFDTYNDVFHYWSEPKGSSSPDGYESDYEFAFKHISANQDTITLKGKKYGQYAQLIRLKESGDKYMDEVFEQSDKINDNFYETMTVNGKNYDIAISGKIFSYSVTEGSGEDETLSTYDVPFVYNNEGIHLYSAVTLDGVTFQDLTYDESSRDLSAVGASSAKIVHSVDTPLEYEDLIGTYTVVMDGSEGTVTVKAKVSGESYTITGLTYSAITVQFNKDKGSFEIHPQATGTFLGFYYLYLSLYNGSAYSIDTSLYLVGYNFVKNGSTTIRFKGGPGATAYSSFREFAFYDSAHTNLAGYWTAYDDPLVFVKD